ncbi:bifunctional diaminohydroxyphosphoribosylaminopyrimidine deaminase/5-amino-6-(5-phosphoribosylamino)uracil reductase RibD [Marinicrinis sediminis]|uniref:Riboflavin biosynthesis protein RibD n=1 Tax=Marinicrinis sediminis TaxID=1652465 RepID=A0ABW5RCR2_9BACL
MSNDVMDDQWYMQTALQLAAAAQGQTDINPVVGCVIVKQGRIIGMGAHLKRGEGHAEVLALQMAGSEAEGATAYVTLEPCSHFGKTPPCADRLIEAGVKRVVVATEDPNPQVAGRGIARLREHGIDVTTGILGASSRRLNERFNKFIVSRLPFVTLKSAMTLDGKVATRLGDSKWISNEAARQEVHTLRHQVQAIMVGVGTILADDPLLTTRLSVPGLHPVRIVVDSLLRTPIEANVITNREADTILICAEEADPQAVRRFEALGIRVIRSGKGKRVDLTQAMQRLGEIEISSILVEGGATLAGQLLKEGLIDNMIVYVAPKLVGGSGAPGLFAGEGLDYMRDAWQIHDMQVEMVGDNIRITGYPKKGGGDLCSQGLSKKLD